jgi:hypothetical protein
VLPGANIASNTFTLAKSILTLADSGATTNSFIIRAVAGGLVRLENLEAVIL